MGTDGAPVAGVQRSHPHRPPLGRFAIRHVGSLRAGAQHAARYDPLVVGARTGQVGRHLLVRADDLDDRPGEAADMSAAPKKAQAPRRDYDRRRKRGPIRRTARPFWRQPLLLGLVVLLFGSGGGAGWWAWPASWAGPGRDPGPPGAPPGIRP